MPFLNLKAVLGLNASGFQLGLKNAESAGKRFSRELKSELAKAFGTAALVAWSARIIDSVDNLTDLSDRLQISTDELQEWGYAAKKNGANLETVTRFFEALGVAREDALSGNERAILSFQRLGVSLDDLRNKRIQNIGKIIGGTIENGDIQKLIGALKDVGGEGGLKMAAAFKAGLDQMASDARETGSIIAKETLNNVKELKSQMEEFQDQMAGPTAKVLSWMNYAIPGYKLLAGIMKDLSKNPFSDDKMTGPRLAFQRIEDFFNKRAADAILGTTATPLQSTSATSKPEPLNKIYNIFTEAVKASPVKSMYDRTPSGLEGLTPWQKAGAAVNQNPFSNSSVPPVFDDIAKESARTNDKLAEIKDVLSKGNFTAARIDSTQGF